MRSFLVHGTLVMSLLAVATPAMADPAAPCEASTTDEAVATAPAAAASADVAAEAVTEEDGVVLRRIPGEVPDMAGLVVVRDAETGELRAPTAAEFAELQTSVDPLMRSDAGLIERHYPDGTVGIRLEGRYQSMSVVQRNPETGEVVPTCTSSAHAVSHKLAESPAETEEPSNDR